MSYHGFGLVTSDAGIAFVPRSAGGPLPVVDSIEQDTQSQSWSGGGMVLPLVNLSTGLPTAPIAQLDAAVANRLLDAAYEKVGSMMTLQQAQASAPRVLRSNVNPDARFPTGTQTQLPGSETGGGEVGCMPGGKCCGDACCPNNLIVVADSSGQVGCGCPASASYFDAATKSCGSAPGAAGAGGGAVAIGAAALAALLLFR